MNLLHVGYEQMVNADKISAITKYNALSIRKRVQFAKENNRIIDCTRGYETRSVIFLDDGQIVLSHISCKALSKRNGENANSYN